MEGKGVRRVLQPALYLGIAILVHALLFLVPSGTGSKPADGTTRGMRIRAVAAPGRAPSPPVTPSPARLAPQTAEIPPKFGTGPKGPQGSEPASGSGGTPGGGGGPPVDGAATPGAPPVGEYAAYIARLRSEGVQGWARDSASRMRQGWKGTGKGGGGLGIGYGAGAGAGAGGRGGGSGRSGGGGTGDGYLDSRVRMVVTSYPPTTIERRFTMVAYPDLKVKKHEYTAGWWNVFIQMRTDASGKVTQTRVLRPETDGPLERIFVDQVRKEIGRWTFDRAAAEINVDVRFYVE